MLLNYAPVTVVLLTITHGYGYRTKDLCGTAATTRHGSDLVARRSAYSSRRLSTSRGTTKFRIRLTQ